MEGKVTGVRLNMNTLMQISNEVNAKMCEPIAQRAARSSGYASATVQVSDRPDVPGWARSRVLIGLVDMRREAKHGRLARAIGG